MNMMRKLSALALSAALLFQGTSLGVYGDEAIHKIPENEPASATAEHEELPGITVDLIQWQAMDLGKNYVVLRDGGVVTANHIRVRLILSGDPTDLTITVNGKEVVYDLMGSIVLFTAGLVSGRHTMTVTTRNGDTALTKTVTFRVAGDASYPALDVETPEDIATGQSREFVLTGEHMENVERLVMNVEMTRGMQVDSIEIADGLTGSYTWFRGKLTLTLTVSDPDKITNGVLATVQVTAPDTLPDGSELSFEVVSTEVELTDPKGEDFIGSFDPADTAIAVDTLNQVRGETAAVIGRPMTVYVKDKLDHPAVGVALFAYDGTLLGMTDEEGKLITAYFSEKGLCRLYARDDAGATSRPFQFRNYLAIGDADGTPYALRYQGASDTGRTVSWMSHYIHSEERAELRLSTSADMSGAQLYTGTSVVANYNDSFTANRLNSVTLSDLTPGTVYYYQVGDGHVWSDVRSFTTEISQDTTDIAIFGNMLDMDDLCAEQLIDAFRNADKQYDALLMTGPVVENYNDFHEIETFLDRIESLTNENDGPILTLDREDDNYNESAALSGNWDEYTSYLCGNVYLTTLHDLTELSEERVNTIAKEAITSGASWRILSVRQAPFSTNAERITDPTRAELLVDLAERGGFDLVISGNEQNYARTAALYDHATVDTNGTVYMIPGSIGGAEPITANYPYAASLEAYNALYLSVTATQDTLTVNVIHVKRNGRTEIADSFVMTHDVCQDGEHYYRNGLLSGKLVCDLCGRFISSVGYEGIVLSNDTVLFRDETEVLTGWNQHKGDWYYTDPTTYQTVESGIVRIEGVCYTFEHHRLVEGAWIGDGQDIKLMWAGKLLTNTWHTQSGKTYYFLEDGRAAVGDVAIPTMNHEGEMVNTVYRFDKDGALVN